MLTDHYGEYWCVEEERPYLVIKRVSEIPATLLYRICQVYGA